MKITNGRREVEHFPMPTNTYLSMLESLALTNNVADGRTWLDLNKLPTVSRSEKSMVPRCASCSAPLRRSGECPWTRDGQCYGASLSISRRPQPKPRAGRAERAPKRRVLIDPDERYRRRLEYQRAYAARRRAAAGPRTDEMRAKSAAYMRERRRLATA